jgi:hypothetical protein
MNLACLWRCLRCIGNIFPGIFASRFSREFWRGRNFGLDGPASGTRFPLVRRRILAALVAPSHPEHNHFSLQLLVVGRREASHRIQSRLIVVLLHYLL